MKTEKRAKRALELRKQGLTFKVIAQRMGVSPASVQYYLKIANKAETTKTTTPASTILEQADDLLRQAAQHAALTLALEEKAYLLVGRHYYTRSKASSSPATASGTAR